MPIQSLPEFDSLDSIGSSDCAPMESARTSRALRRQKAISQKALQEKFLIQAEEDGSFDCMFCNESFKHHEQLGKHVLARHKPTLCEPTVLCVEAEYLGPEDKRRRSAGVSAKEDKDDNKGSDCEVCGQTFIDSTDLETHMKKHKDSFTYSCNICGRRFKEPWFLKNHQRTHFGRTGGKNKQAVMETPMTINEIVQEPGENNVPSAYKLCKVCGFYFPNKKSLLAHSKMHIKGVKSGTCKESATREEPENVSKEGFLNSLSLKPSKSQAEKPETSSKWIGELDPFNTYQAWQLATKGKVALGFGCVKEPFFEVNMETESDKDETTDIWNTEKMSQSVHSDETDTTKDDDSAGAAESQELDEPKNRKPGEEAKVQNGQKKTASCPDCGRVFKTYQQRVLHSHVHRKDRSDSESSSMSSIEGLRPAGSPDTLASVEDQKARRIKMEDMSETEDAGDELMSEKIDGEAALKQTKASQECGFCGKRFRTNYYLSIHLRTHTGEKPYKCEFCDYAAAQKTSLRYHLERHHKFKPGESNAHVKRISKSLQLFNHSLDPPANIKKSKMSQKSIIDAKKDLLLSKLPKRMAALHSKMLNTKKLYQGEQTVTVKKEPSVPEEQRSLPASVEEHSVPQEVKSDPETSVKKEETSEETEDIKPLNLSMKSAGGSAPLSNRASLAWQFCPHCTYKTLYPEVLIVHHSLVHKQHLYRYSNKSANPGLRSTGCPPALGGKDVYPLHVYNPKVKLVGLTQLSPKRNVKMEWTPPSWPNKATKSETDRKHLEQENKLQSDQQVRSHRYQHSGLQAFNDLYERLQQHAEQPNATTSSGSMLGPERPYMCTKPNCLERLKEDTSFPILSVSATHNKYFNLLESRYSPHNTAKTIRLPNEQTCPIEFFGLSRSGNVSCEQPPSDAPVACNPSQNRRSTSSMEVKRNPLFWHKTNQGSGPNEKRA